MGKWNFDKIIKNFDLVKKELPVKCGMDAVNYFRESFNTQSFDGKKWKEVQRRISGTNAYKYPKGKGLSRRTRAILIKTGRLKRGIVLKKASFNRTVIINEVPYASYHNEGTKHIPRRQFMNRTDTLDGRAIKIIKNTINKLFKK